MTEFELFEDKLIGEGSFGKVYQCLWRGSIAAAKVYNIGVWADKVEISQEVQMIKELQNDYIMQFFGAVYHNERLCMVTRYEEKGSLRRALAHHNLSTAQKPGIITGLIKGMCYLKEQNVIHRDLKSPNVLLDKNYVPKICGFDLAVLKPNSEPWPEPYSSIGTIRWMAPELFKEWPCYSFASDVYSLGIVIWEILMEKLPYAETVDVDTIAMFIKNGDHEEIPDSIPDLYKSMIKNSWHLDPKDRITVEEMCNINEKALWDKDNLIDTVFDQDISISDDEVYSISVYASSRRSSGSIQLSMHDTPSTPGPEDYVRILHQYLKDTFGDLDTKSHLESVMYICGDGFTQWIKSTAEQSNVAAGTVLGEMYYHGIGVPQDYQAAITQFVKIAEEKTSDQSDLESMVLSAKSDEQGNARAQKNLGWMYEHGKGVPKNDDKAAEWYAKAAEQGHVGAQNRLGQMYENGKGVPQNDEKAVEWYSRAAEQGDARAQYNLGQMYECGSGVAQSDDKAIEWYTKAAEQGDLASQKKIGHATSE